MKCIIHNINWDISDPMGCPICYGYGLGREEHRKQHQCNADLETRAALRQEGRELEKERIIQLLDSLACQNPFCRNLNMMRTHTGCRAVRHHIRVIKGEE